MIRSERIMNKPAVWGGDRGITKMKRYYIVNNNKGTYNRHW